MWMLFQWHRNWKSNNNFVHPPVKSISSKVSLLAYKVRTEQNVKKGGTDMSETHQRRIYYLEMT